MILLRLFGTVELRRESEGELRSIPLQPKRLALLAYLAVRPQGFHRRDTLLGLFWPELDSEHARGALSKAVHYLRRSLGEGVLVSHGDEELRIDDTSLWCDVAAFDRAAASGAGEEAVELYRGDFLTGFFLSDSPEFERWLAEERDRLRRRANSVAWDLATASAAAENHVGASAWARRAYALSPDDEGGLRRLLEVLDCVGDRAGALRAYEEFTDRLARDYELEPSADTLALIARLREKSESDQTGARPRPPRLPPRGVAFSTPTDAPSSASREPLAAPAGAHGGAEVATMAAAAARGGQPRQARSALRYRIVTAGALTVLAVGMLGYTRLPRASAKASEATVMSAGKFSSHDRLLLADFEVHGVDSALGRALTLATRTALEQSEAISLMSATAVAQGLVRMQRSTDALGLEDAREVAIRTGARAVVHGEVTAVTGNFLLSLRLVEAESGNTLIALGRNADGSIDLLPAIDDLARQLRSRIGESLATVRATPPLERVTTSSLEALQKYTAAYRAHYSERDAAKAVLLLQEAVAIDTGFAMAWRLLRVSAGSIGIGSAQYRDSVLQAAFRHRDRATPIERDLITAIYHQAIGRDRAKAASAYEAIVQRDPDNVPAIHSLAIIYTTRREFARAESLFKRTITLDPDHAVAHGNMVLALWQQEKWVEAERTIAQGKSRFPNDEVFQIRSADLFWFRGDLDRYERALDGLRASNSTALRRYGLLTRSNLALMRGRLAAHRELQTEARASGLTFSTAPPVTDSLIEARIDAQFRDDREQAVRRIDATLELSWPDSLEWSPLGHVVAYSVAGRPDRARTVLDRYLGQSDTVTRRWQQPALEQSRGWIRLAEGKHAEAIAHFRRGDLRPDGAAHEWVGWLPLQLALTYDAAGQPDSAIVMFERYLRPSIAGRGLGNGFYRAHAYDRLGQLYASRGNRERAAHYTAQFVELWKDADPELQPRVAAARQRLAGLRQSRISRN